jgi:hypothetical protein
MKPSERMRIWKKQLRKKVGKNVYKEIMDAVKDEKTRVVIIKTDVGWAKEDYHWVIEVIYPEKHNECWIDIKETQEEIIKTVEDLGLKMWEEMPTL